MKVVLGIDIGGSTTKVAGFTKNGESLPMLQVDASDRITSMYGAIGSYLSRNSIPLDNVSEFVLTGVGSSLVQGNIYGIETKTVNEFSAIGMGGLHLSGKTEALVVSLGTGTAFVRAGNNKYIHIGGSGVGGGTMSGLGWHMLNERSGHVLESLAKSGNLENIDLSVGDICSDKVSNLLSQTTASNFGKIKSDNTKNDIALAIFNIIFQTIGMLSVFALKNDTVKDVVLTGSLATCQVAPEILRTVEAISDVNFTIPDNAAFATAIGAALPYIN